MIVRLILAGSRMQQCADFLEGSLQISRLASCLFLQAQSSSPTSAPAVFSVLRALFSCNPAVFLETSGFFQITTPRVLFLPSQQPPRKSPKLPARRADVTAAGRARPRGFVLLRRLRLSLCRNSPAGILLLRLAVPQRSRTAAQGPVFCCWMGTPRLCPESRTNRRHGRDGLGLAFWLCDQPVFSIKSAYLLLAASSSSLCICRS